MIIERVYEMLKKLIKEIIIILLLIIAIVLILGVLLYEYVPSNKIVPEKISYTTPEKIQQELQISEEIEQQEIVITYQIDSTDLNNYKKIQEYIPGKKNPFAEVPEEENNTIEGNITTDGNAITDANVSGDSSSTGYLPDKGTK